MGPLQNATSGMNGLLYTMILLIPSLLEVVDQGRYGDVLYAFFLTCLHLACIESIYVVCTEVYAGNLGFP